MKTTKIKKSCWPFNIRNWTRLNFDNSNYTFREQAEKETDQDLQKDPQQLLCDVHEEALNPKRPEATTDDIPKLLSDIVHANKRFASLLAKTAITSERLSKIAFFVSMISIGLVFYTIFLHKTDELNELQNIRNLLEISAAKLEQGQINHYNCTCNQKNLTHYINCHKPFPHNKPPY